MTPGRLQSPASHPGFSLLELVIVIALVIVLIGIATQRLAPLRGDAEAAHVATVIGSLRSALGLKASARVIRHGLDSLEELAEINPVDLLREAPANWQGVLEADASPPPGSWYFDGINRQLVYRVRYPQYLDAALEEPFVLRWRVTVQTTEALHDQPPTDRKRIIGLALEPLQPPGWSDNPVPD